MFRIMIVDDEPDIIESVKTILEAEGYEVVGANSGSECLKKLKKEPADLILMDFFMPGMDGRRVIEKIRENPDLKDIKIAFLTSAAFRGRGMKVIDKLNVLDYISKPIEMDDFILRIKKLLEK